MNRSRGNYNKRKIGEQRRPGTRKGISNGLVGVCWVGNGAVLLNQRDGSNRRGQKTTALEKKKRGTTGAIKTKNGARKKKLSRPFAKNYGPGKWSGGTFRAMGSRLSRTRTWDQGQKKKTNAFTKAR